MKALVTLSLAALASLGAAVVFAWALHRPAFAAAAPQGSSELGRATYLSHCEPCHGVNGDGHGPASVGMRPFPRDFTRGEFKFTRTGYGTLPSDAALRHTIRDGLNGTPMQGWALSEEELVAVIAYLKTLSVRWKEEEVPAELEVDPDPWTGRVTEAVAEGKGLYHRVGCASCHPSYEPYSLERVALKDDTWGDKVLPISFTVHRLKSGETREDVYRVIASGVSGAAMPGWKGMLPEDQLWALAYYVESLARGPRRPAVQP